MTSFLDEPVPKGLYFVNAPDARTRREATADYMKSVQVAEARPTTENVVKVLHEIASPYSDGSIIDRMITVQADQTIRKSVRRGRSDLFAERRSIDLVTQNTSVPVPRVHTSYETSDFEHLIMDKMPGDTLQCAWPRLTEMEREDIADQVVQLVNQLCQLQSASIKAALLHRKPLRANLKDAMDFNAERMKAYDWCGSATQYVERRCAALCDAPNVFTHGDLDWSNIMISNNKVCGIIDWESSGFFPPYWEWVCVKRMSSGHPEGSWFSLLEERLGRNRPSEWAGMWEVEKLMMALSQHSHWGLTPEDRKNNRAEGWAAVNGILGGDRGLPPPQVDYSPWSGNPWWLDYVCKHESTVGDTTGDACGLGPRPANHEDEPAVRMAKPVCTQ